MLKYIILFPFLIFLRSLDSFKKKTDQRRFWEKVLPDRRTPSIKPISSDYAQFVINKKQLNKDHLPNRILMGVNDEVLGRGWSPLILDYPKVRKMKRYAVCFLRNKKSYEFIQVHGLWLNNTYNPLLEIEIEKVQIGSRKIEMGWHTYIFPFKNNFEEGAIELSLRITPSEQPKDCESEFAVNEIGLFSLGTPTLRWFGD